jgi:hypothetical protein
MKYLFTLAAALVTLGAAAQQKPSDAAVPAGMRAIGSPVNPKVPVAWNYYRDYKGITDLMQQIVKAHPNLAKLESIGKSVEGRDIWVLTVTDFKSGRTDMQKPGFYTDGNIHSNELQGTEFALYGAWYLVENYGKIPFITQLLKEKSFYFLPTINPDAREYFITKANTANSGRSGMFPIDDDGDGLIDEDDQDDLDGDGEITMMRRKSPMGRWKVNPSDPRQLVPAKPEEAGEYEMLGIEGIDNDGDGLVNEDRPGTYDPNRDWGWNWQPDYIQGGAFKYPFSFPENRAVMEFVMKHPNIAGAQSYHNYGGMFLRGPGAEEDLATYDRSDVQVYDAIGQRGNEMIPGYRYLTIYKDLYTVFGGEIDWFHGSRGIFMFSNELMTSYLLFNKKSDESRFSNQEFYDFDKYLLFGDAFVEWKPFKHPQYGDIEIGGFKRNYIRNHPGFLIETDGHRNAAFTLFHAYHTPQLEIRDVVRKDLGNGLSEITATIANSRLIPTHSSHDIKNKINPADYVTLKDANVVTGLVMTQADGGSNFGGGAFESYREQKRNPRVLAVPNVPGMGFTKVRWIVRGTPANWNIEVNSLKGGLVTGNGKF